MKSTFSIKQNRDFRRLYSKGRSAAGPCLALYARTGGGREKRLGITVSTKLGCAVVRNRVRRRLREIYRLHEAELTGGLELVIVARVRAVQAEYAALEREFLSLARRLGLLCGGESD